MTASGKQGQIESQVSGLRVTRPIGDLIQVAVVLATSAALLFFDLGRRFLATNDETRFPLLARDILERGHWLLPQLNGVPHLNKPPLYAWLIALASWPAGAVTQGNAALVSLLAALGVVLATYWIGGRLFGRVGGTAAGLIAVTTAGVFALARVPMPDMALCAAFTAAMAAYVAAEFEGRRSWLVAFYCLVGIAFWIKGPAGLLPLAVVLAYTLATDGWRGLAGLRSVPGFVLLGACLVSWPVLGLVSGGGQFVHNVVVTDLLGWYTQRPSWSWRLITEPVAQAFTILLPWSLVLPVALWKTAPAVDASRARQRRLLVFWLAVIFAFVAASAHQRFRYYLPLCPPAALVIAMWYSGLKLRHRTAVFASVWILVAMALSVGQVYVGAHHNAASSLRTLMSRVAPAPATLYAVDAPELVFAFYLQRPVRLLSSYADFERLPHGRDEYLVIAPRALPDSVTATRKIGTDVLNGYPLAVLQATDRP